MALLPDRRARIIRRIEVLQAQLDAIDAALTGGLTAGGGYVQSYEFSDGHGTQRAVYRRVSDLQTQQEQLEAQIERLYRKLSGTGIKSLEMRRKGGGIDYP
jgi:hypothetical protein